MGKGRGNMVKLWAMRKTRGDHILCQNKSQDSLYQFWIWISLRNPVLRERKSWKNFSVQLLLSCGSLQEIQTTIPPISCQVQRLRHSCMQLSLSSAPWLARLTPFWNSALWRWTSIHHHIGDRYGGVPFLAMSNTFGRYMSKTYLQGSLCFDLLHKCVRQRFVKLKRHELTSWWWLREVYTGNTENAPVVTPS